MGKTKTKKMRGSKTCGYGAKKKHRGKGSKGGSGFAGSKKHKKLKILKIDPNHFKHKKLKSRKVEKIINIQDLNKFEEEIINLKELGYTKLLGNGEINRKIKKIIIDNWSKKAEEKIKTIGGEITTA